MAAKITREQADKIKSKNSANVINKMNGGNTLTAFDFKILKEQTEKDESATVENPRIFGSMKAASAGLNLKYADVIRAKRAGCAAFKANGNVHEDVLIKWVDDNPRKAVAKKTSGPSEIGKKGAGEALKRLEDAEVSAHAEYMDAKDGGDEDEISPALKQWREITNSLLSYETKVEASKRDAGTLIPRNEVIEAAQGILFWTKAAVSDVLHNAVPLLATCNSAREAAAIVDPIFREALPIAMTYAQRSEKLPPWLAEAALRNGHKSSGQLDALVFESLTARVTMTKSETAAMKSISKKLK